MEKKGTNLGMRQIWQNLRHGKNWQKYWCEKNLADTSAQEKFGGNQAQEIWCKYCHFKFSTFKIRRCIGHTY